MRLLLSCLQAKIENLHVEIYPHMTSKNRLSSSVFELNQDTPEIHPWYKFGPNETNICWVIMFTSENCKFSCWNRPPWPQKIGQGHHSSILTKTLLRYIHGRSLGPMQLIISWWNCKFSCWNRPLWPRKIGNGHPSSNLTKTLLRYIHGISMSPMRLIFVESSCLQAKIANFMLKSTSMTSKNRSRSSIFKLNQDTPRMHEW